MERRRENEVLTTRIEDKIIDVGPDRLSELVQLTVNKYLPSLSVLILYFFNNAFIDNHN